MNKISKWTNFGYMVAIVVALAGCYGSGINTTGGPVDAGNTQVVMQTGECQSDDDCAFTNTVGRCIKHRCNVVCAAGFADCNANLQADGCEVNVNADSKNCGGCGLICSRNHVVAMCQDGVCSGTCAAGFDDCNGDKQVDGCETSIATDTDCGGCGQNCGGFGGAFCGKAQGVAACLCHPGFTACGSSCADLASDPLNCGGCGMICGIEQVCHAGKCTISCGAGEQNCNGACVDTSTNSMHCGACGQACNPANAVGQCNGGRCSITACNTGFADCDGLVQNGCEVNLQTDPQNCGVCKLKCPAMNGAPVCNGGACGVDSCNSGYGDCDGNVVNGCETNTNTNPNNCGACGNACSLPNATAACGLGTCKISQCNAGWADCNNDPKDGCEANLGNDPSHCGACGNTCVMANGTSACNGGVCTIKSCALGYGDCDGNPVNGCETSISSDPNNCGGCNTSCSQNTPTCSGGKCVASCSNQKLDGRETDLDCGGGTCNGCQIGQSCLINSDCLSTHCLLSVCSPEPTCKDGFRLAPETDVDCGGPSCSPCDDGKKCLIASDCKSSVCSSINHSCLPATCHDSVKNGLESDVDCGGNCQPCGDWYACKVPTDCVSGVCAGGVCRAGNCSDGVKNGTETDVDCGGACLGCNFGGVCKVNGDCYVYPNTVPSCSAGACKFVCATGFADCNSDPTDGCEISLNNISSCGACGRVCTLANSTPYCSNGGCVVASCNASWANCDGVAANGCETSITTDVKNCGACGRVCNGKCDQGTCVVSCNDAIANGQESDVDCGGPTCGKCVNGRTCKVNSDCVSNICSQGRCQPSIVVPPADMGVSDMAHNHDMGVTADMKTASDMGVSDMKAVDMAGPKADMAFSCFGGANDAGVKFSCDDSHGQTPLHASGAGGGPQPDGTPDCFDDDGDGACEMAPCCGSNNPNLDMKNLVGGDCDDNGSDDPKTFFTVTTPKGSFVTDGSYNNGPGASEWCDGYDNNCNGVVDDACKP